MKQIQWKFLIIAILAVLSLIGLGISIGQQNLFNIILSIICFIVFMGIGFTLKRKAQ